MSFFPSDWDDEEDEDNFDPFQGDIDSLVSDFENKSRDNFTARELMELFRFYNSQIALPGEIRNENYSKIIMQEM